MLAPGLAGCSRASQDTMTWADGTTYTGEWKDGKRHGKGTGEVSQFETP